MKQLKKNNIMQQPYPLTEHQGNPTYF